jgi:hypothetical protein
MHRTNCEIEDCPDCKHEQSVAAQDKSCAVQVNTRVLPLTSMGMRVSTGDPVVDLVYKHMAEHPTSKVMQQFVDYHVANPGVYSYLVTSLKEMQDANYKRYGFPLVFNLARWHFGVKKRNTEFELNNNIAAHYSRAIAILNPDLEGFYEMRKTSTGHADIDFDYMPTQHRVELSEDEEYFRP